MVYNQLLRTVDDVKADVIEWRRDFHKYPEVGFELERTAKIVANLLKSWGVEVREKVGVSGVVGLLKGTKPGKTVALRADMDALPMMEENDINYKSVEKGKMHACGHDGHTAMLLGAAKVLSQFKKEIHGNIKFIFQPAEEGPEPGGAKLMVEDGAMEDVDAIFGMHISTQYPTGYIAINMKNALASTDVFEIEIIGKGGHAGLPHESVDAIAIAARVINEIQYLATRQIDPTEPIVISVGTIKGGYVNNVIAGNVLMTGTIRTHSNDVRKKAINQLEEIVKGITTISGASCNLKIIPGLPPLINDFEKASFVKEVSKKIVSEDKFTILDKPGMGAEDFAFFLEEVPGAMFWLGARNEAKGKVHLMHHPKFDFDEEALAIGVKLHSIIALEYLNNT